MLGHLVVSHAAQDGYAAGASPNWLRRALRALFGKK
jgi:hypothetical protein